MKQNILFAFLFFTIGVHAQEQNNIWYFGEQAGLDFSSGSPVVITNSALNSLEGSAIQCDNSGDLLFYTNGGTFSSYNGGVWNRNHQLMPNGSLTGTSGCNSSVQSCVIIPFPGNANKYYIFTTDCQENSLAGGLAVNIVDLTLDGGLGDLIVKDSTIYSGQVNEALYSIPHSNGTDYWLITHTVSTYDFMIYKISASGIGAPTTQTMGWPAFNGTGQMAANINGDKFAFAVLSRTMLFDFNKTTGTLSNYIELVTDSQGLCFSPNCRYLYTSYPADNIWQFDLLASNIPASKTSVATPSNYAMQMQLAPNGKIYVTRNNLNSLAVISSPDNPAATAGYQDNALSLGTGICKSGLPNIQNFWYQTCGFNSVDDVSEQNKNSISIHPNPANENITIKSKNQLSYSSISIYDLSGKMVLELFTEIEQIDVSNLDNGIYFLELKNENDVQLSREKFIISGN